MKNLFLFVMLSAFLTNTAYAYNIDLAKSYENYFSPFVGMKSSKEMQLISAASLVESQVKGDNIFILDIRTPGETAAIGFNWTNSIAIPMNEVFKPENLKKIPTTMKVVVVCKGGLRAVTIATGLRHIGFKNVFMLKGGFAGLAAYISPKNVH